MKGKENDPVLARTLDRFAYAIPYVAEQLVSTLVFNNGAIRIFITVMALPCADLATLVYTLSAS